MGFIDYVPCPKLRSWAQSEASVFYLVNPIPGDDQPEQFGLKMFFQSPVPNMVRKRPGKESLFFSSTPGFHPGKPAGAPGFRKARFKGESDTAVILKATWEEPWDVREGISFSLYKYSQSPSHLPFIGNLGVFG